MKSKRLLNKVRRNPTFNPLYRMEIQALIDRFVEPIKGKEEKRTCHFFCNVV